MAVAIDRKKIQAYLEKTLKGEITDIKVRVFGGGSESVKGYGYGRPLFLDFACDGEPRKLVLETMPEGEFGHEGFADRAQIMLWKCPSSQTLPKHARCLDSGAFLSGGELVSLGGAEEFFVLTEFKQGEGYFNDLDRLAKADQPEKLDLERAKALAIYLAEIHKAKKNSPNLYKRRIRELVGHGECLMGLVDSYPEDFKVPGDLTLEAIEIKAVQWRWRLRGKEARLCQVHGDFHPWNILFQEGSNFTAIDRSRGEWGEAADDVTALSINYIFFSLQHHGKLTAAYEPLFRLFWDTYLEKSGDEGVLEVVQPFFAWRGLVVASPVWYPSLAPEVRGAVFRFIRALLESDKFDPAKVNEYLA